MPLQIIQTPRLYRQIADHLRDLIRSDEFKRGTRLPAERDLALQLGVSRPSVREALIALEVEGWIEIRKGSGIYVCNRHPERSVHPDILTEAHGPLELIRARSIIEGEIAALAAKIVKTSQLAELEETVAQMAAEAQAGRVPMNGDRLFHLRLADIAGNSALTSVVALLFDERNSPIYSKLGQHMENERSWTAAMEEHRMVIEALSRNDPDRARNAMQQHLDRSHRRYSRRLD